MGGSDQRGNVTTGMELIRKKLNEEAFALTIPLITDASGKKFGKSEGNAIWLDPAKNSPYFVYQFFMNIEDALVDTLLKVFSLKSLNDIQEIVNKHLEKPELRYGQKELASWVVEILFGKEAVAQAQKISAVFFGESERLDLIKNMSAKEIDALAKETGGCEMPGAEAKVLELFTLAGITESNGEAKKLIAQGALFVNEEKVTDLQQTLSKKDFLNGIILLRK